MLIIRQLTTLVATEGYGANTGARLKELGHISLGSFAELNPEDPSVQEFLNELGVDEDTGAIKDFSNSLTLYDDVTGYVCGELLGETINYVNAIKGE